MGQGHLKLEHFQTLLDENPSIAHVELSNYGEIFLNPRLVDILKCAYDRRVTVSAGNGVNLNHASAEVLEALVEYRVRTLNCSIDGVTQETYAKYRVNGNLHRVLENIDAIRAHRQARGSAFPLLDWQFVVFGHNEHELPKARALARQRGMGFRPRLSWDAEFSPVKDRAFVQLQTGLGAASREEFRERHGHIYAREVCFQLWRQPVMGWDGRMMGCCVNYWQDFGTNVFVDGLASAIEHPNLHYARKMLTGSAVPRPEIPCTRCHHFKEISEASDWLTESEILEVHAPFITGAVIPVARKGVRFAEISFFQGWGEPPPALSSGTMFRFGQDVAAYVNVPGGSRFSACVRALSQTGWSDRQTWRLESAPRPLCQQWTLDLSQAVSSGNQPSDASSSPLKSWIR
jgi:hypothetical protein